MQNCDALYQELGELRKWGDIFDEDGTKLNATLQENFQKHLGEIIKHAI
jgi:hypothetical protein